ncbi:hypothetical protein D0862_08676 [Hortaea werneckii]|uniref:Prenylcysteine lyase domain-containing protein n=1 Tax=Hortaea werneckii TaxID=91943 RepID=A0A3M7G3T9_HORWE|nr:hypothetical protein D0862_08676 [Hortaea werneckii]
MRLSSALLAITAREALKVVAGGEQVPLTDTTNTEHVDTPLNVAIIGAGAAGSSSAYHLAQFAQEVHLPINITIFDRNPYIGGRSTTVNVYDDPTEPVELGASIFVEANQILLNATRAFNLSTTDDDDDNDDDDGESSSIPGAALAIWDGKSLLYQQTTPSGTWWETLKLLWKYGPFSPLRTRTLQKSTLTSFLQLYNPPFYPFDSLTEAAAQVGLLPAATNVSGEEFLRKAGVGDRFAREVVQAATRVNYAQNLRGIHGLEAMVCLAAEGARAVRGGNWRVFDRMVGKAGVAGRLLGWEVVGVEGRGKEEEGGEGVWAGRGGYTVRYREVSSSGGDDDSSSEEGHHDDPSGLNLLSRQIQPQPQHQEDFDTIILAAPYQSLNLTLTPSTLLTHVPSPIPYVHLHVTLFTTPHLLSPTFFNLSPADEPAPRTVLTTLPPHESPGQGNASCGSPGFFSISLIRSLRNPGMGGRKEYLYKIFSPERVSAGFLSRILGVEVGEGEGRVNDDEKDEDEEQGKGDDEGLLNQGHITWLYRKLWDSYPYETPRDAFEPIRLSHGVPSGEEEGGRPGGGGAGGGGGGRGRGIWYTGGMESFISTMETNALMGRNVARLIVDEWVAGGLERDGD